MADTESAGGTMFGSLLLLGILQNGLESFTGEIYLRQVEENGWHYKDMLYKLLSIHPSSIMLAGSQVVGIYLQWSLGDSRGTSWINRQSITDHL